MIEINLVPGHLRRKRKSKAKTAERLHIPREKLIGLGGGFIVILIVADILLQVFILVKYMHFKNLKSQWEEIRPEKENTDRVITELRVLENKQRSTSKIAMGKNILWAEKLNQISDSVPRGVWFRKVSLVNDALIIEGSAVSNQKDEMINVHEFTSNLKNNRNFLNEFSGIDLGSIQRRNIKKLDIADFTITAKIKNSDSQ